MYLQEKINKYVVTHTIRSITNDMKIPYSRCCGRAMELRRTQCSENQKKNFSSSKTKYFFNIFNIYIIIIYYYIYYILYIIYIIFFLE
ncbi:MAG: hypothetical protein [Cotesia congregata filamentous virus 2]